MWRQLSLSNALANECHATSCHDRYRLTITAEILGLEVSAGRNHRGTKQIQPWTACRKPSSTLSLLWAAPSAKILVSKPYLLQFELSKDAGGLLLDMKPTELLATMIIQVLGNNVQGREVEQKVFPCMLLLCPGPQSASDYTHKCYQNIWLCDPNSRKVSVLCEAANETVMLECASN